jgi:predicted esterase
MQTNDVSPLVLTEMPGWFNLYDWPIGISAKDDKAGKLSAVDQIEETVERLEKEMGIPPSRIVVGGFSQGGAVALLAAYHRRQGKVPFAGCVCLSGWLTLKDDLTVSGDVAKATPLFWGHGQWDDKVLFEQQSHGVERLRDLGVDVTDLSFAMGHESHPKEIGAMAEFLERVFFEGK